MKKRIFFNTALVLMMVAAPFIALADTNPVRSDVYNPTILAGPILICSGVPGAGSVGATCTNICDLIAQIENIIYYAMAVVIWIIAPIMIAVGGIMILLEGASPHGVETAKKSITGAIWGIVIVLCAYIIVYTFVSFLGITGVGGFGAASCSIAGSSGNNPIPVSNCLVCGGTCDGSCPGAQTCSLSGGTYSCH